MKKITIESVDLTIKRTGVNEFEVKLGDIPTDNSKGEMQIGDIITVNIPAMLITRDDDGLNPLTTTIDMYS